MKDKKMGYKKFSNGKHSLSTLNKKNLDTLLSTAFFRKALTYFEERNYLECLASLDKLKRYNNSFEAIYFLKAIILGLILKDFNKAIEEINAGISLNPNSEKFISLKGKILNLQYRENYNYFYI